jgi:hypothetical protein
LVFILLKGNILKLAEKITFTILKHLWLYFIIWRHLSMQNNGANKEILKVEENWGEMNSDVGSGSKYSRFIQW